MKSWLVLALALALVACSPPHPTGSVPSTAAPVAVAKGVVEAQGGLLRLVASRDGVLAGVWADEGAHVEAGQLLARLDRRQAELALESADADLGESRARLATAVARADGAKREAARLRALAAGDAAPRQDADQASTAALAAQGERQQAAEAVNAAQARRRLAAFDVDTRAIRAPVAGYVVRRLAGQGGYVAASTPIFVIAPDGERLVRAELDEVFADRVALRSRATVSREFQAGASYPASVTRISDVLGTPVLGDDAASRADARVINVLLRLPPATDLRIGQRVLVRFEP